MVCTGFVSSCFNIKRMYLSQNLFISFRLSNLLCGWQKNLWGSFAFLGLIFHFWFLIFFSSILLRDNALVHWKDSIHLLGLKKKPSFYWFSVVYFPSIYIVSKVFPQDWLLLLFYCGQKRYSVQFNFLKNCWLNFMACHLIGNSLYYSEATRQNDL